MFWISGEDLLNDWLEALGVSKDDFVPVARMIVLGGNNGLVCCPLSVYRLANSFGIDVQNKESLCGYVEIDGHRYFFKLCEAVLLKVKQDLKDAVNDPNLDEISDVVCRMAVATGFVNPEWDEEFDLPVDGPPDAEQVRDIIEKVSGDIIVFGQEVLYQFPKCKSFQQRFGG